MNMIIVAGFLGVGKTTVLRQLIKRWPKQDKIAILVNEFGDKGFDGERLRRKLVRLKS